MLLLSDIGNAQIALGVHDGTRWRARWRLRTVPGKTADEYLVLLRSLLAQQGVAEGQLRRGVLACVVPPLAPTFREVCREITGTSPLEVGPGVRTGIDIRTDHPSEVGADLVADALAAYRRFNSPCIVVDFGTATTFTCVVPPGALVGVAIAPGVGTAAQALAQQAAQLPQVPLTPPRKALGKNTRQAMQSGLVFGFVGLVEGLIRRLAAELGEEAKVIATGTHAPLIAPLTPLIQAVDPWLTLEGLRLIAELNP